MREMPSWKVPKNIAKAVEDGDGSWEDERWSPFLLTVMSGTEFEGREIPLSWQIEFDPSEDEFEATNARLEAMEIEPDGYGWGEYLQKAIAKANVALANNLHTTDCETGSCVIWVESAEDCRALLESAWKLAFEE